MFDTIRWPSGEHWGVEVTAMRFRDRADAGRVLAARLAHLREAKPVVVGLPRGGVPVAAEIASALDAELDVVLVRKIGAPDREELAVGAVGEEGVTVRNEAVLRDLGLTWEDLGEQVARERDEIRRRAAILRPGPRPDLRRRTVIVVDDGIATGATVIAALRVLRDLGAARIVLAVPVAPPESLRALAPLTDEVVCPATPKHFSAVGQWYDDFTQVPDEQVRRLLG
jgi:putative phosphoribosyl transferase